MLINRFNNEAMKLKYYTKGFSFIVVLAILILACKQDQSNELSLKRSFAPNTITTTNGETAVTVAWPISLFTTAGQATYAIEVSPDLAFTTIAYTTTTNNLTVSITDNNLTIKKDYYARVKTIGLNGSADSNWTISPVFRITGEQFLNPVTNTNLTDVAVQLTWRLNPDLTKITITPTGGSSFDVTLDATDKAAGVKVIPGLTQKTTYTAEIFADVKSKGTVTFKTLASITGNIVDISATASDILQSTITGAASGSVIVLRRGQQYTLTAAHTKSITLQSQLGFGTNYAIIRISANNIGATANIDSLVFRDLVIKGGRALNASFDNDYILNMATAAITINKIRLDNCTIKIFRGIVRENGATTRINNYFVNNCVIDSIRDFSIAQVSVGSGISNISVTNSTIYKARKFINHGAAGSTCTSVLVDNCTFNEVPSNSGTNYLIDFNAVVVTGGITIRNSLFGKTWDEVVATAPLGYRAGSGTGLTVINCYTTSDLVFSASPLTGPIGYTGSSTALFTNPSAGNFTIKDTNFIGKSSTGDPRWRIN
ncbi:MAG TPA: DUF5123 domain-containing protein [Cyclobacteriaceae bacterium]|nr:DUF5123 domain-containing protein [Cyclobacteriaceae bacterium]